MTERNTLERAMAFVRRALRHDLKENVSEATIKTVAKKVVKVMGSASVKRNKAA
jgi:hypothetical protein